MQGASRLPRKRLEPRALSCFCVDPGSPPYSRGWTHSLLYFAKGQDQVIRKLRGQVAGHVRCRESTRLEDESVEAPVLNRLGLGDVPTGENHEPLHLPLIRGFGSVSERCCTHLFGSLRVLPRPSRKRRCRPEPFRVVAQNP